MLTAMPFKSPRALERKLADELRPIACAPIPPRTDRRFANWDPSEIFPPGRWGQYWLGPAKPKPRRAA
jgi:hypothetical protein